ncbi:MAG: hypothetical protein Q9169_006652 [Polycauliona sp. 2 TL-2023]
MAQEFESMDTQRFRQDDVHKLTDALESQVRGLEDINGRVNVSVLQLEKALKRYIAQVRDGERASSIRSTVSSSTAATTMSQKEWRMIQEELKGVGITATQFNIHREKIVMILSKEFPEDVVENPSTRDKKPGQLIRLLSALSFKSRNLLAAADRGDIKEVKTLLARGAYVDARNSANGETPLLVAVRQRNLELTNLLLAYKPDVNDRLLVPPLLLAVRNISQDMLYRPMLDHDAKTCNIEIINSLLDNGADVNQAHSLDIVPLHVAVEQGSIDLVNNLLDRGAKVNVISYHHGSQKTMKATSYRDGKLTPLSIAVIQGSIDIAKSLVSHGCDVNQAWGKITPISLAFETGYFDMIQLLVQNGAHTDMDILQKAVEMPDTNALESILTHPQKPGRPKADLNALAQIASTVGNREALGLLIDMGVDINPQAPLDSPGGKTLVWLAAAHGRDSILPLLLGKGADIEKPAFSRCRTECVKKNCLFKDENVNECTAVQIAVSHNHWKCVRILLSHGGDLNARLNNFNIIGSDDNGTKGSLLHLVINGRQDPKERLRFLLDMEGNVNIKDSHGRTPLHWISWIFEKAHFGGIKLDIARIMITKGAIINCRDHYGRTALHYAIASCERQTNGLIAYLLGSGADPNVKNNEGQTPTHWAGDLGNLELFDLLIKAGGKTYTIDDLGRTPQSLYTAATKKR